jgi:hypothetical protein
MLIIAEKRPLTFIHVYHHAIVPISVWCVARLHSCRRTPRMQLAAEQALTDASIVGLAIRRVTRVAFCESRRPHPSTINRTFRHLRVDAAMALGLLGTASRSSSRCRSGRHAFSTRQYTSSCTTTTLLPAPPPPPPPSARPPARPPALPQPLYIPHELGHAPGHTNACFAQNRPCAGVVWHHSSTVA